MQFAFPWCVCVQCSGGRGGDGGGGVSGGGNGGGLGEGGVGGADGGEPSQLHVTTVLFYIFKYMG